MASTLSFSVSSFSSSRSSPIPPPQEERHRSNDSSESLSVPESSSSGVMTGAEAKVLQALEVMKSLHDFDSNICLESLGSVRKRFSIPNEYVLHAPKSGQRPYHPCLRGFSISIDALEARLSLMRGNPRAGGASSDCAPDFDSSTTASIGPARPVRLRFRCAGDPNRGGRGVPEASRKHRGGGDSADQKRKD
ncbi:hypothetical protein BHM03_00058206 [Ensete ventricosum]|nr:hypothetical protein BHM03_00058206 [Ensete ventricosum]